MPSEQPCERTSLDVALNIAGVEKIRSKTCGCAQHWRSFNTSLEGKERSFETVEVCFLFGWISLNHFDIVQETPYSCDTVGCETYRVILCLLLCPETDWKIRVGKQDYLF